MVPAESKHEGLRQFPLEIDPRQTENRTVVPDVEHALGQGANIFRDRGRDEEIHAAQAETGG